MSWLTNKRPNRSSRDRRDLDVAKVHSLEIADPAPRRPLQSRLTGSSTHGGRTDGRTPHGRPCPRQISMPSNSKPSATATRRCLIVAGAGSGKTRTLVHRVAYQIQHGVAPSRILLLTFTRRAAGEMLRRVDALLRQIARNGQSATAAAKKTWGGTFHAVAARLLRIYGKAHRPQSGIHDPRSQRLRGLAGRDPHRAGAQQEHQAVPQEGHLHGDLQPVRELPATC